MERKSVQSSVIKSIGYDLETSTLEIELTSKKEIRQYLDCPQYIFIELIQATSIGRYFLKHVKSHYKEIKPDHVYV